MCERYLRNSRILFSFLSLHFSTHSEHYRIHARSKCAIVILYATSFRLQKYTKEAHRGIQCGANYYLTGSTVSLCGVENKAQF